MGDEKQGAIHFATNGGVIAKHPDPDASQLLVAPATSDELNTARLRLIPIACFSIDDVRFKFDSSFVLPAIQAEITAFSDLRKQDSKVLGAPISIFGHADPSFQGNFELGSSTQQSGDDYNKTLSGRRAIAIYALLIRDPSFWNTLYSNRLGGDVWGLQSIQIMLDALNQQGGSSFGASSQGSSSSAQSSRSQDIANDSGQRQHLFLQYMNFLCADLKLDKSSDFLARGAGPDQKGDVQGCSRFNPRLLFSSEDEALFKKAFNNKDEATLRDERDPRNSVNRRVMILIFRKGSQIVPAKWPCPTYKEESAGCKKRFFSDGDKRRSTHTAGEERKFDLTQDTFACRFYQRISNNSPCHAIVPPAVVTGIKATVGATKAIRDPKNKSRIDNILTPSSSDKESLDDNKPVVLVRGCLDVQLQAITVPPNLPVQWFVKPNENDGDAPAITPSEGSKKAILKTDKTGSFSVIAAVGVSRIVWNVVFVWVKVDPATTIKTTRDNYHDLGVQGGWQSFQSGDFVDGKFTWEVQVDATVIGGGKDKKLGIDRVHLGVLQNGVADTLSGNYTKSGSLMEAPLGGLPVVDSNGDADTHPMLSNLNSATVKPDNTGPSRTIWTADSPGGVFPVWHRDGKQFLSSVSGIMGFQATIASLSIDAPNAFCVHAKVAWHADFAAKIVYSGSPVPVGKYVPNGATTFTESEFSLISDATGGQDAGLAGFETFEPRWNNGRDYTHWSP
jgi:hypothetical protein